MCYALWEDSITTKDTTTVSIWQHWHTFITINWICSFSDRIKKKEVLRFNERKTKSVRKTLMLKAKLFEIMGNCNIKEILNHEAQNW